MSILVKQLLASLQTASTEARPAEEPEVRRPEEPAVEETPEPVLGGEPPAAEPIAEEPVNEEPAREPEAPVVEEPVREPEPGEEVTAVVQPVAEVTVVTDPVEPEASDDEDEVEDVDADEEAVGRAEELVDATADVRDTERASEELDIATEGLSDVRETLVVMNDLGGVSAEAFPFIAKALEAYTDGLGVEQVMLGVSAESYQGEGAPERQAVSLEDLDDLIGRLQKAKPSMEGYKVEANKRLSDAARAMTKRSALSFEAFDEGMTSDVDADALSSAQVADEIEHRRELAGELADAQDGIADIGEMIEDCSDEKGGLSTEALIAASLALEAYTAILGLPEIKLVESMEGLDINARHVVSTEGVGDAIKSIGQGIANLFSNAVRVAKNAVGALSGKLPTVVKQFEELLAKANAATGETSGDVKVGNVAKRLHQGGELPQGAALVKYLADYSGFAGKMCGPFTSKAYNALNANIGTYEAVDYTTREKFFADIDKAGSSWQDPRKLFSNAEMDMEIPGGGKMFGNRETSGFGYKGDSKGAEKLDDFVHHRMINGLWVRHKVKAPKVDDLKALSLAEIKEGAEAFLKALKGIKIRDLEVSGPVVDKTFTALNVANKKRRQDKAVVKTIKAEIGALDMALWGSLILALEFGWHAASEYVDIARSFMGYAYRSLATAGKPSTESDDSEASPIEDGSVQSDASDAQPEPGEPVVDDGGDGSSEDDSSAASAESLAVSMEADIKQLKAGKKVKYSHGHGKIVKVFTAPFKYKGETHMASKETPKYEVKSDKGSHLSIHKASALTLI